MAGSGPGPLKSRGLGCVPDGRHHSPGGLRGCQGSAPHGPAVRGQGGHTPAEPRQFLPISGDQQKPNVPRPAPCYGATLRKATGEALTRTALRNRRLALPRRTAHLAWSKHSTTLPNVPSPRFPTISSRREKKQGMRAWRAEGRKLLQVHSIQILKNKKGFFLTATLLKTEVASVCVIQAITGGPAKAPRALEAPPGRRGLV